MQPSAVQQLLWMSPSQTQPGLQRALQPSFVCVGDSHWAAASWGAGSRVWVFKQIKHSGSWRQLGIWAAGSSRATAVCCCRSWVVHILLQALLWVCLQAQAGPRVIVRLCQCYGYFQRGSAHPAAGSVLQLLRERRHSCT